MVNQKALNLLTVVYLMSILYIYIYIYRERERDKERERALANAALNLRVP